MKCTTENCPYEKLEEALGYAATIDHIHGGGIFTNLKEEIGDAKWTFCPYCGKELVEK